MKYLVILVLGLIIGIIGTIKVHYLNLADWLAKSNITTNKTVETGQLILDYLKVTPVKKIATLEVLTEHTLIDDYFKDFKILDFDTPEEFDRLLSQIIINGKVKVNAVYGYTSDQIGIISNPESWGEPKLLYYEIVENNIDKVAAGIGIGNNTLVKRVVNVVLQGIHDKLRSEFASNQTYIQQAKANALCKFGGKC